MVHTFFLFSAILSWFVSAEVAAEAIGGEIIEEGDVEVRPEKVPASCIDENVCLESCRKYCSADAWIAILDVVSAIERNPVWYCGIDAQCKFMMKRSHR